MRQPWQTKALGDAGEWFSGGTPSKSKPELWIGTIPWISPKDMKVSRIADGLDHVSEAALGNGTRLVPPQTVLVVVRGMILAHTLPVAVTKAPVAFNQDIRALRPSSDLICDFVLYWLQAEAGKVLRLVEVANHGTKRLPTSRLMAMEIPVPPLGEQRKIAAILSSVDELIAKTEAVIEQLEVVKKAMMQELLTRGLPGRHTRFKQTELGEIPEPWEVLPLSQVGSVQTGMAKGRRASADMVEVPYLRVANVQDGFLDLAEVKKMLVEPTALERYSLRKGDVLFTEGGDADKLGRGCVWHAPIAPCLHQNHVFVVRPDRTRLLPQFLSYFGASQAGRRYFLNCAKQTTNLASINSTQLKGLPVAIPSIGEQQEIVSIIGSVAARVRTEHSIMDAARVAKAALMSVLLTGEIRVQPDEEPASPARRRRQPEPATP